MLAGCGGVELAGDEASGEEGGVGNGRGAGLTPTDPGVDEELSRMNVLPSAGGLGGEGGAAGGTGAGVDVAGLGAALGFVGIPIAEGGGGDVVVGGSGVGAGAADTVEGISPDCDGCAGAGASFGISGCFVKSGVGGGGVVSFALASVLFWEFSGFTEKTDEIFGPDEGALVADLLNGAAIEEGPLPDLVGVGGEGGGDDPELTDRMVPLPPVWVIDAADGLCTV